MDNQDASNQHGISISMLVHYFLLLIGLCAEFFALKLIINLNLPDLNLLPKILIYISVLAMLTHQFLIVRNFHILDHIQPNEYLINSIGDWVAKCRTEDLLRFLLFFIFAFLTGEIVYLLIVGSESLSLLHSYMENGRVIRNVYLDNSKVITNELYDLKGWLTPFYVKSALAMSCLMFLWDILGYLHDRPSIPKPGFNLKINPNEKIVYFPASSPYYIFIVSDALAVYFWSIITYIVLRTPKDTSSLMTLMSVPFLAYCLLILMRVISEVKINSPKIRSQLKQYKMSTFWWRG